MKVGHILPLTETGQPVAEQMPEREPMCPPHDFEAGWATPPDAANHEDTVPALWCKACGDIRAFRLLA